MGAHFIKVFQEWSYPLYLRSLDFSKLSEFNQPLNGFHKAIYVEENQII